MKPRVKIIAGEKVSIPKLTICTLIMDDEGIPYDTEVNTMEVARLCRGHFNPITGFMLVFPGNVTAKDHYGLIQWIENNCLKNNPG